MPEVQSTHYLLERDGRTIRFPSLIDAVANRQENDTLILTGYRGSIDGDGTVVERSASIRLPASLLNQALHSQEAVDQAGSL